MTRVYVPTTLAGLALLAGGSPLGSDVSRLVASGEDEVSEYAAMAAAAEESEALLDGPGRRVVVVAEFADPDGEVWLRDVVAVHADPVDRPAGADPDEDLAWYATQEVAELLGRSGR